MLYIATIVAEKNTKFRKNKAGIGAINKVYINIAGIVAKKYELLSVVNSTYRCKEMAYIDVCEIAAIDATNVIHRCIASIDARNVYCRVR